MWTALALALLGGCVYQKHLDNYEVWLDSPDAARVTVEGADVAVPLEAGGGEQSVAASAGGFALEFRRFDDEGIRVVCPKCYAPVIVVEPSGKIRGEFEYRAVHVDDGHSVTVYRPYYLSRYDSYDTDWLGYTSYSWGSSAVLVGIGADWEGVRRIQAIQKPRRGLGWALLSADFVLRFVGAGFLLAQKWVPGSLLVGASVGLGVTGGSMAFRGSREIVIWQDGSEVPER